MSKIIASGDGLYYLIRALYSTIGNKVYMQDLKILLEDKLKDIDGKDNQTLLYLAHDISDVGNEAEKSSKPKYW